MLLDEPQIVVLGGKNITPTQALKQVKEAQEILETQKKTHHQRRASDIIARETLKKAMLSNFSKSSEEKPVLVLDLDETLIHAVKAQPTYPAKEVKVQTSSYSVTFWVAKRPGVEAFLKTMSEYFEIVIYTMGTREYAEMILAMTGLQVYISRLFHRDHCVRLSETCITKDLSIVGTNFAKMVFIDDAVRNTKQHPQNSLLVSRFQGSMSDCWLSMISSFLLKLAECDDFRSVSRKFDLFLLGYDLPTERCVEGVKLPKEIKSKTENTRMTWRLVDDDSCLNEFGDEGITSSARGILSQAS